MVAAVVLASSQMLVILSISVEVMVLMVCGGRGVAWRLSCGQVMGVVSGESGMRERCTTTVI